MLIVKDDNIQIEKLSLGSFGTNCYLIKCQKTQNGVLIDAPDEMDKILKHLDEIHLKYILLTHNHMDHIGAISGIKQKLNVPLATHPLDAESLNILTEVSLNDGEMMSFGKVEMKVLHTPGHTPGSLCFLLGKYLFSGDTIFPGGPGKTWSTSAFKQIVKSIKELFTLPEETQVHPGHGNSTTIREEKEKFAAFSSRSHDPNLCGDVLWLSS